MACSGLPWAAHLISALADGITPSVFLSAQESKGPEYCFSVPEAFSRLVLEHKVRPTARLAAIFLTSLHPRAVVNLKPCDLENSCGSCVALQSRELIRLNLCGGGCGDRRAG